MATTNKPVLKKSSLIYLLLAIGTASVAALSFNTDTARTAKAAAHITGSNSAAKDSAASKKAFLAAYRVLMHPRCMNCHPSGDAPLQGDDSHVHTMNVQRGPDGKGLYALKCSNCHQPKNTSGLHMPPGNPNWHLPPADMKMVFQGKTPRELAAQLLDPERNGHKSIADLIEHVTSDTLVKSGWDPGDGRTLPPLSHQEFARQFKTWLDKGAYLPDK